MSIEIISILSQLPTQWPEIRVGQEEDKAANEARQRLCTRYDRAVRKFLERKFNKWFHYLDGRRKKSRAAEGADELASQFAMAVLKGEKVLKSADQQAGKFRHYLQRVLGRWVIDYIRKLNTQAGREGSLTVDLGDDTPTLTQTPESDPPAGQKVSEALDQQYEALMGLSFVDLYRQCHDNALILWKAKLLERTLAVLATEETAGGPPYHTLLRLNEEQPGLGGQPLADELSRRVGRPITKVNVRAITHRARKHFAELLVEQLRRSLESVLPAPIDVETLREKLQEMNLVNTYVAQALEI